MAKPIIIIILINNINVLLDHEYPIVKGFSTRLLGWGLPCGIVCKCRNRICSL